MKIPSELYLSMLDELKVAYQEHGDLLRDDMIEAVCTAIEENGYSIVPVEMNVLEAALETISKGGSDTAAELKP